LAAIPDTSISGPRGARELTAVIAQRGKPGTIVSDHGTEFTSNAMLAWFEQALALYDTYHEKASACDVRIEAVLKELSIHRGRDHGAVPPPRRRQRTDQANALAFDVRAALFALLGKGITAIDGLGAYLSLKLVAECGDDLSSWPSAKHFTSWLGLAPSNKISGGKMLSSRTAAGLRHFCALLR